MLKIKRTDRGFLFAEFVDCYAAPCSVQKSSVATEDCVWLGREEAGQRPARMHLSRDQVADLLPLLQHFVETGELPAPEEESNP